MNGWTFLRIWSYKIIIDGADKIGRLKINDKRMVAQNIIDHIAGLIAKDELEAAMQALHPLLKKSNMLDELIIQSARYNDIMKQVRLGTLDFQQIDISKNKIRFALIEITQILEESLLKKPQLENEFRKAKDDFKSITITNSKNINTGNINTGGGDFNIGDGH